MQFHYNLCELISVLHLRTHPDDPYFRITGPPKYENMTTLEVFKTLDWTNETLRNRYQDLLLEKNTPMMQKCARPDNSLAVVSVLVTDRQQKYGKVMFSVVPVLHSVILFTGGPM